MSASSYGVAYARDAQISNDAGNAANVPRYSSVYRHVRETSEHIYREIRRQEEVRRREILARQIQTDQSMSIFSRRQTEYDPLNIRLGSFLLEPSISSSFGHTDNVYETPTNKVSSNIFIKQAGLKIKSDFSNHLLESEFQADDGEFISKRSENYKDYRVYIGGRVDVTSRFSVPLGLKYSREHAKRDDPDDSDGAKPTVYSVSSVQSGFKYVGGLLSTIYTAGLSSLSYDDNVTNAGVFINNHDRNRAELTNSLTFSTYESGRISPFVFVDYRKIKYDDARDDFNIDRDSHGWGAGVGAKVTLSGVTSGVIKYGKLSRTFDDPSLEKIDAQFYGVDANWEPTSLLGFNLSGQRYVDESSLANTAASINSTMGLKVTYEMAPNIYLYPEVGYLVRDYQSTDDREIDRLTSGVKMTYKMNRNIWSSVSYLNATQDEERNGVAPTTTNVNTVLFSLKLQL